MIEKHKVYLGAWGWFSITHMLWFLPYVIGWVLTGPLLDDPAFIEYWLYEIIVPTLVPLYFITESLFIYAIFTEKEDSSYKILEPLIAALFYAFTAISTAYMIVCDY